MRPISGASKRTENDKNRSPKDKEPSRRRQRKRGKDQRDTTKIRQRRNPIVIKGIIKSKSEKKGA